MSRCRGGPVLDGELKLLPAAAPVAVGCGRLAETISASLAFFVNGRPLLFVVTPLPEWTR
jgi:hypothetical protein